MFDIYQCIMLCLDTRWIKHDTDTSSNGLRGKIATETAANDAVGAMASTNFAPRDTKLVSKLVGFTGLGNKGNLFAIIKLCILGGIDTPDFNERHVIVLVTKTSLESQNGTIYVETRRPLCIFCCHC